MNIQNVRKLKRTEPKSTVSKWEGAYRINSNLPFLLEYRQPAYVAGAQEKGNIHADLHFPDVDEKAEKLRLRRLAGDATVADRDRQTS